jgi:hypothetical protein
MGCPDLEYINYGFKWGPLEVIRVFSTDRGRVGISVRSSGGAEIHISVPRSGRHIVVNNYIELGAQYQVFRPTRKSKYPIKVKKNVK